MAGCEGYPDSWPMHAGIGASNHVTLELKLKSVCILYILYWFWLVHLKLSKIRNWSFIYYFKETQTELKQWKWAPASNSQPLLGPNCDSSTLYVTHVASQSPANMQSAGYRTACCCELQQSGHLSSPQLDPWNCDHSLNLLLCIMWNEHSTI